MRLLDFQSMARSLYEAGTSVHLKGGPGIGKTSVARNIRAQLSVAFGEEFGFVEENPNNRDATDYGGLCFPTKDGAGGVTSFYTRPAAAPTAEYLAKHPRGIILLEELEQAEQMTKKALARVILERVMGNVDFGSKWWVIATSNRSKDRSGVGKALAHIVNRTCEIEVEADVNSWSTWAEENGVHPMYIAFAKQRPGVVFSNEVPSHGGSFCSPRSFVAASKVHGIMAGTDSNGNVSMDLPSDGVASSIICGHVGESSASEMFSFFKLNEYLPKIEDILKDPMKAKVPSNERLDASFVAAQMLVHFANAKNIDTLWQYAERLPKELQTSTAQSLVARSGSILLNSKALGVWMSKNKALINASGR